jgi:hypothetical protein
MFISVAYVSVGWSFLVLPSDAIRIMWHLNKTKEMSQLPSQQFYYHYVEEQT